MNDVTLPPVSASALNIGRDLVLDLVHVTRGPRDLVDALILAAITQANVGAMTASAEHQLAYGVLETTPPDELRRPVSISRLAQGLEMPFETVRRRLRALTEQGVVQAQGTGVIVPAAHYQRQESRAAVVDVAELTLAAYQNLVDVGFFDDRPLPGPLHRPGALPARAVARLVTDYALRVGQAMRDVTGDYLDSLLLMHIMRCNTAHFGYDRRVLVARFAEPLVGDDARRPVPAAQVALDLGMPRETTRRRLARLEARGFCQQTGGGLLLRVASVREMALGVFEANDMNLWRLFRTCAQLGVLEFAGPARDGLSRPGLTDKGFGSGSAERIVATPFAGVVQR